MPALGAEGRHLQGRKLVWGGREYGALRLGTPRHSILHLDPQATTFLSPPGGIYLICPKLWFISKNIYRRFSCQFCDKYWIKGFLSLLLSFLDF